MLRNAQNARSVHTKKCDECAGGTICDSQVYSLPSASGEVRRLKPFSSGEVAPAAVPQEVLRQNKQSHFLSSILFHSVTG